MTKIMVEIINDRMIEINSIYQHDFNCREPHMEGLIVLNKPLCHTFRL